MLVATSIIESGIDIPQANTLIVERADIFGLGPALPDPRARRPQPRARLRLPAVPERGRADRGGDEAPQRAQRLHRARRRASRSRCATSRSAAPATCSATSSPGHVAALGFELYLSMLDEAVRAAGPTAARTTTTEPVRLDVNVDAYVPADYIPYEQAKIDVHRRIAGAREVGRPRRRCATSSRTASGRCPSRSLTCSRCSRRGSSSARPARARCTFTRGRHVGHADRPRRVAAGSALREELPEARYEPGRAQVSLRCPRSPRSASRRSCAPPTAARA